MKKTEDKIIEYIEKNGQATPDELSNYLNINRAATHRQIKKLLDRGKIYKIGKSPKVFYLLSEENVIKKEFNFGEKNTRIIDQNFLMISPRGERKEGVSAFVRWCEDRNENVEKTADEYVKSLAKFDEYKEDGFIDGSYKIKKTFDDVGLDKVFYSDFYSIERFGKTKLGQLLLYAKQSQNKNMIQEIVDIIKPKVEILIKKEKIDAVGFIPPTVRRDVQIMREMEKKLKLNLPSVSILKVKTEVSVPQKTLNKLKDRVENAKSTFIVDEKKHFKNVLLIDDALGSGSTLNEVAKKIKKQKVGKKVIGLAIAGSFSGFEIISEV